MLKYDYTLERNLGKSWQKFSPAYQSEFTPITRIQGDNDIGKTTILQIIAIGLFGNENATIKPKLKEKLKKLLNRNYSRLEFEFEIEIKPLGIKLISRKKRDNNNIDFYEIKNGNKTRMNDETLSDNYRLIYDVPDEPTTRITELLDPLKETVAEKESLVKNFLDFAIQTQIDLDEARSPNEVSDLKKQEKATRKKLEILEQNLSPEYDLLSHIEKFTYTQYYLEQNEQKEKIKADLILIQQQIAKIKPSLRFSSKQQITQLKAEREKITKEVLSYHNNLKGSINKHFSKSEKREGNLFLNFDIADEIFNPYGKKPVQGCIPQIRSTFEQKKDEQIDQESLDTLEILKNIINFFKDFEGFPGREKIKIKNLSIDEMLIDLKNQKDKLSNIEEAIKDLEDIFIWLDKLELGIKNGILITQKIKDRINTQPKINEELESLKEEESKMNIKLSSTSDSLKIAERLLAYIQIAPTDAEMIHNQKKTEASLNSFISKTNDELKDKIRDLKTKIDIEKQNIEDTKTKYENIVEELNDAKEKKLHPLINDKNHLNPSIKIIEELFTKLSLIKDNLIWIGSSLKDKEADIPKIDEELANKLTESLSSIIREVPYADKKYQVKSLDLINRRFITTTGQEISFDIMGTGRGQMAYLMTQLESQADKPMIVLLDEVGMMGEESLNGVIDVLKKLYRKGKLLQALIVERKTNKKVISVL